jgi:hypothetical protein
MTLLNVGSSLATGAKSLGKQLSVMNGLQGLYLFSSNYITLGATPSVQNLAPQGGIGTIVGSPTIANGIFTVNTAGTDYVTLPFGDTGGDLTFYWLFRNLDTDATSTTSPVIIGNTGSDAAHGNVPAGTKGTNVSVSSATVISCHDYSLTSGTPNVANNKQAAQTVPTMATPARWMMGAGVMSFANGICSITIYDGTIGDNVASVVQTTNPSIGRAYNATNNWRLFSNLTSSYGLMASAGIAIYETAAGAGGAHVLNQVNAVFADLRGIAAGLSITV